MTIGEKIQRLRKERGLSQEALAGMLYVTRQTVSKWELGQSTPDLALIAQLSELFQVSANYLIKDNAEAAGPPPEAPSPPKRRLSPARLRLFLWTGLSGMALTACFVCFICDYFTSGGLGWSWIVAVSVLAGWLVCRPAFTAPEKRLVKTLRMASIVPFPLLGALALLLGQPVLFSFGACAAALSAAACWAVYGLFRKCRSSWRAAGFALLLMIPFPIGLVHLTAWFFPAFQADPASDLFHSGITLTLALACFGVDALRRRKKEDV